MDKQVQEHGAAIIDSSESEKDIDVSCDREYSTAFGADLVSSDLSFKPIYAIGTWFDPDDEEEKERIRGCFDENWCWGGDRRLFN